MVLQQGSGMDNDEYFQKRRDEQTALAVNKAIGCCLLGAAQAGRVGQAFIDAVGELKLDVDDGQEGGIAFVPPMLPRTIPGPAGVEVVEPFRPPSVIRFTPGQTAALPIGAYVVVTAVALDLLFRLVGKEQVQELLSKLVSVIVDTLADVASDCAECCRKKAFQQANARVYVKTETGVIRPRV